MASTLVAKASNLKSDGLHPSSVPKYRSVLVFLGISRSSTAHAALPSWAFQTHCGKATRRVDLALGVLGMEHLLLLAFV